MNTAHIIEKIWETPNITTLKLDVEVNAVPGQFIMVWIPEVNEKPFSLSSIPKASITIAKVGKFSKKLADLNIGDKIGFRGPYGKGFDLKNFKDKKILAVGGGVGIAPLMPLLSFNKNFDMTFVVGAKNKDELLFVDMIKKSAKLFVSTDDGSYGFKGFVTDVVDNLIKKEKFDLVLACGKRKMLEKIFVSAKKAGIQMQFSMEGYMKCSIGVCGTCSLNGLRVCVDGPVFSEEKLSSIFKRVCE